MIERSRFIKGQIMMLPKICPTCGSHIAEITLCLQCFTGHTLRNRNHVKKPCQDPWHSQTKELTEEQELITLRQQVKEIIDTINLLPSVTHGPVTRIEDVVFAIRDLQEAYGSASRSRNALNEKDLKDEIDKLRYVLTRLTEADTWSQVKNIIEVILHKELERK